MNQLNDNSARFPHYINKKKLLKENRDYGIVSLFTLLAFVTIVWMTGHRYNPMWKQETFLVDRIESKISLPNLKLLESFFAVAKGTDIPQSFQSEVLSFESNSISLKSGGKLELDQVAKTLERWPMASLRVEAFSDHTGDLTKDKDLAFRRAVSVKEQLVSRGINPDRLDAVTSNSQRRFVKIVVTNIK